MPAPGVRRGSSAKMNALVDPQTIEALYRASGAGVKVDLIVRGICALRPGLPGVSENITVRSVVGRFLEHSRVFYFENGGEPELYCASADWMERNFFRRVEVALPGQPREPSRAHPARRASVLPDNTQAWMLRPDGSYVRLSPAMPRPVYAQKQLLALYAAGPAAAV